MLEALDELLVVLRESIERNRVATRRAQTIRRLRSHGRSYAEILRRVEGALNLGVSDENVESLLHATRVLHEAEIKALRDEGLTVQQIAKLSGETPQRASDLLADETPPDPSSQ